MLNSFTAEHKRAARFPALFLLSFCEITGDDRLQREILSPRLRELLQLGELVVRLIEQSQNFLRGQRRHLLEIRLRALRALLSPQRMPKSSFSRRLFLYARRFRIAPASIWRWLRLFREGGVDALRDHLRRDTLTRRAPANEAKEDKS
jgi:hypothetical protein